METIRISREQFDKAKQQLLKASQSMPKEVRLEGFREDADWIRWFSHKVTGEEVNKNLVEPLHDYLMAQNKSIANLHDVANEMYNTIDTFDKEYIAGIRGTAEAAAVASNQALQASNQALQASKEAKEASQEAKKASDKANQTQEELNKTILALQQTVNLLRKFKEDVDNINHLSDVDAIWQAVENHKSNLLVLKSQVDSFVAKIADSIQCVNKCVVNLQEYRAKLESYSHLNEIDTIWQDVEDYKANLTDLSKQVDDYVTKMNESILSIKNDVTTLQDYHAKLESYAHIADIDTIWRDVEDSKANLADLRSQVDGFVKDAKEAEIVMRNEIIELEQKHNQVGKAIKVAYGIAGGSLAFTIIQLALQLMGIL